MSLEMCNEIDKGIACNECMKNNYLLQIFFLLVLFQLPYYFQVG